MKPPGESATPARPDRLAPQSRRRTIGTGGSGASPLASDPAEDPWTHAMRRGNFSAAWEICDRVLRERAGVPCSHLPRHEQWIWDGRPFEDRRVLVRCYHGLGDTVQFIRFMPLLKRIAREAIVWAQPPLLPLLRTASGIDRLLPLHDGVPEVEYDVDVELMELPHAFRTTLETLPNIVPYLHVPRAALPASSDSRLKVGLFWRTSDWELERSIPTKLATWFAVPGVQLYLLQQGRALQEWPRDLGVFAGRERIEELAGVMRALDLVITPDSFPAHLAGALGVRTWTLLPSLANWRWIIDRDDSPWYPTMRLFWQREPGNWADVMQRVVSELSELAGSIS